jgi:SNF2 family DNA or RNA helicase
MSHLYDELMGPDGQHSNVYYSPFTKSTCRGDAVPKCDTRGGFICEEMGMGKTIITLGLVMCNPAPLVPTEEEWGKYVCKNNDAPLVLSRATLVICPVSLVGQWVSEARSKLGDGSTVKIHEYHGQKRIRDPVKLATFDLVVSTYETLSSDLRMWTKQAKQVPAASRVNWYRIVMDESHKSKGTSGVTACLKELRARRRWCVTGTPCSNQFSDFAGQFQALCVPGLSDASFWKELFQENKTKRSRRAYAQPEVNGLQLATGMSLFRRIMVRHTKDMTYSKDDTKLLVLPPKREIIQWIKMSKSEGRMYRQLEKVIGDVYRSLAAQGELILRKNTIKLLALMKDLQMACSGGNMPVRLANILTRKKGLPDSQDGDADADADADADGGAEAEADAEIDADAVAELLEVDDRDQECPVCMDVFDQPVVTECGHKYCKDCIHGVIAASPAQSAPCPMCRQDVTLKSVKGVGKNGEVDEAIAVDLEGVDLEALELRNLAKAERIAAQKKSDTMMVSKLSWLVLKLEQIRSSDASAKVLVFTQFASTLEWLTEELPKKGFQYVFCYTIGLPFFSCF